MRLHVERSPCSDRALIGCYRTPRGGAEGLDQARGVTPAKPTEQPTVVTDGGFRGRSLWAIGRWSNLQKTKSGEGLIP